ncbi:YhdT family protein [Sporosarcina koreensis]|uniref:YhdT family protein n=1 Tax=Sporosarcina koreensis TaxID=334735 RepID=UPI0006950620|nr:YhdT family protein [Sporosarcina koreensis]
MSQQHNTTRPKQDPRFKTAHKEAWIGAALAVFNFVWWYGFAYGLGSRPVDEYTYILGLPAWFFWSCVAGFVLMSIITVVLAKFVLTDMPLDDDPRYQPDALHSGNDTPTKKGPNS